MDFCPNGHAIDPGLTVCSRDGQSAVSAVVSAVIEPTVEPTVEPIVAPATPVKRKYTKKAK